MDFFDDYLALTPEEQLMVIRNLVHRIKYDTDTEVIDSIETLVLPPVTDENRLPFVRLAVYLGHNYFKKTGKVPKWTLCPKLVLPTPFKGVGYRDAWFFCGEQVFYRHNYFVDPRSLDVL